MKCESVIQSRTVQLANVTRHMSFFDTALDRIGNWIAGRLESPVSGYIPFTASDPNTLNLSIYTIELDKARANFSYYETFYHQII